MKLGFKLAVVLSSVLCWDTALSHDVPVHMAITTTAAASALVGSPGYSEFLSTISSDLDRIDATNAMVDGSAREDGPFSSTTNVSSVEMEAGGYRSLNHFYDPLDPKYGRGLSDSAPDLRDLKGTNSFAWASVSNCVGITTIIPHNTHPVNQWSWQNAREIEWVGLTATNQVGRAAALADMFRAVGQVMHLLEDTSQPQHVRNEQHLDQIFGIDTKWRSPIEDYYKDHPLNYQQGMLDWKADGFTKMEDFWDAHKYNGDVNRLRDDLSGGPKTLGLAEWCNGNFVGVRHSYAEYFKPGDIQYYPYPARKSKSGNYTTNVDTSTKDRQVTTNVYLSKNGDGISIAHHSVLLKFGRVHPEVTKAGSTTIDDPDVLKDYHDAFIPKAVNYSAGLLDYFFRGTMVVTVSLSDTNTSNFTNIIQNTSGQDFHGGTFYVLQDSNTVRSILWQTNLADLLQNPDASFTNGTTLNIPCGGTPTNKLLLVYQGTIGFSNGAAFDPVDSNICIAVGSPLEQTITYTYDPTLVSLGLAPGSTITTNLNSDDFYFTPTDGNYQVLVNFAYFDDKGTIGSIPSTGPITSCSYNAGITNSIVPNSDVMVVGNHLSVPVTATDDPSCDFAIGWRTITITWRAWPAP